MPSILVLRFRRLTEIEKSEIFSGSTKSVSEIIDYVTGELKTVGEIIPWNMTISGYDSDPRPLAVIPEVKEWFTKVHRQFPYFPIFLSDFSLKAYVMCVLNLEVVGSGKKAGITDEEQAHIDAMVKTYNELMPGTGDDLREQLEGAVVYSVNPADVTALCAEISFAVIAYLTAKGIGNEKQRLIVAETMARIKSAIEK